MVMRPFRTDISPLVSDVSQPWNLLALSSGIVIGLVCWPIREVLPPTYLFMIFLAAVLVIATRTSVVIAALSAVVSTGAFHLVVHADYLPASVVPVHFTLSLLMMVATAVVVGHTTNRLQVQRGISEERERHTAVLYHLSRSFAQAEHLDDLARIAVEQVADYLQTPVAIWSGSGPLSESVYSADDFTWPELEEGARACIASGEWVGAGTSRDLHDSVLFIPLTSPDRVHGVLMISMPSRASLDSTKERFFLQTLANQIALSQQRRVLAERAQQIAASLESERLRNALLSSISHDFRTPLGTIMGTTSTLLEHGDKLHREETHDLLATAFAEAERLNWVLQNLLSLSRMEGTNSALERDWHVVEELISNGAQRFQQRLADKPLHLSLPESLTLANIDGLLIELLVVNLLDNGIKATPEGGTVEVQLTVGDGVITLRVSDTGPGIPAEIADRVFDKFVKGPAQKTGVGLGLAICREIAEAHGGTIELVPTDVGATLVVEIPCAAHDINSLDDPRMLDEPSQAEVNP